MAIRVIIEWKTFPGNESLLNELLVKTRTKLLGTKGYIYGETLRSLDDPSSFIVISAWNSLEDWNAWVESEGRKEALKEVDALLRAPSVHRVFICG